MSRNPAFRHMLLYIGPKTEKRLTVPGSYEPVHFKQTDESPVRSADIAYPKESDHRQVGESYPIAYVTEDQGRTAVARWPESFAWPHGTSLGPDVVARAEHDKVKARLAAIESHLGLDTPDDESEAQPVQPARASRLTADEDDQDDTRHQPETEPEEDLDPDLREEQPVREGPWPPAVAPVNRGGRPRKVTA